METIYIKGGNLLDLNKRAQLVRQWIYQAADQIHEGLKNPLIVQTKSNPKDLVTNLDQSTEKFIRSQIKAHFPQDKILGEEGDKARLTAWKDQSGSLIPLMEPQILSASIITLLLWWLLPWTGMSNLAPSMT